MIPRRIHLQHFLNLFKRKKQESHNKNPFIKISYWTYKLRFNLNNVGRQQQYLQESREMSVDIKLHVWSRPLVDPFLHLGERRHTDKQSFDVWIVCGNVRAEHTAEVVANTGKVDITPWQLRTFTVN